MNEIKTICFEGIDGCGRNTQIMMLRERLLPVPVKILHFPEYTEFGRKMRDLILETPDLNKLPRQILLWVDFLQTYYSTSFTDGGIYVLDRLPHYSNIAYGSAMGIDIDILVKMRKLFGIFVPDLTFILDVPAKVGSKRMRQSSKIKLRSRLKQFIENRGQNFEYLNKVRECYLDIQNIYPQQEPIYYIDANQKPEKVHEEIYEHIKNHKII